MHIVSLAAVTWRFALRGRTRMLTEAWRRSGQATVFVQVPSYRSAVERLLRARSAADGIVVLRPWPVWPARMWRRVGGRRLRGAVASQARRLRTELDRHIDWSRAVGVVVSPVWTPWLDALPLAAVVYDCIDDLRVQTPRPELSDMYRRWEDELVLRADGAVASAECLAADLRSRRADLPVTVIRNGVDARWFQRQAERMPAPRDLPAGRRRVGFVGALYEWIDWDLIGEVARRMDDVQFVFVGPLPRGTRAPQAARLPNVTLLGYRPYDRVPAYVRAFDVCWVPFLRGRVAQAANPVKIYEYLALGKPVVSTPIADPASFEGLIDVGESAHEIVGLLRRRLAAPADDADARQRFAMGNSWDARAQSFARFVRGVLKRRAAAATPGDGHHASSASR